MRQAAKFILIIVLTIILVVVLLNQDSIFRLKESIRDRIVNRPVKLPAYEYKSASVNGQFPEYTSIKHNFKVRFPAKLEVSNSGKATIYDAIINGEATYRVFWAPFEDYLLREVNIKPFFDAVVKGQMQELGDTGKIIYTREVRFLGYRALEYEVSEVQPEGTMYHHGLHFVKDNQLYSIGVTCWEKTKTQAYSKFDDFIRSFSLISK